MDTFKILQKELKSRINKEVKLDSNLKSLGIDSIELLDFVVDIEERFKIRISDQELLNIEKVQDIVNIINSKI